MYDQESPKPRSYGSVRRIETPSTIEMDATATAYQVTLLDWPRLH